jgi:hypothetical protein
VYTCSGGGDSGGSSDPCFPSAGMVTRADGTPARLDAIHEGDAILAVTADGVITTDTVSLLSIAKPGQVGTFVTLKTTADGRSPRRLQLTAEHHLPVGPECCSTLKQAKDVRPGDTVWIAVEKHHAAADASDAPLSSAVVSTRVTSVTKGVAGMGAGLHSPVLTKGTFPIVDGVVTAFDSIGPVKIASWSLGALERACKATRTCVILQRAHAWLRSA